MNIFHSKKEHKYTLILLHGIYESNDSLLYLCKIIQKANKYIKIILPNAPSRTITWSDVTEYDINAWYNYIKCNDEIMEHDEIDVDQFNEQADRIYNILDEEIDKLNGESHNVIIGGISQGGTLALHVGLNYKKKLGAIIGIHTILIDNVTKIHRELNNIPIYIFAGNDDDIYNIKLQTHCLTRLKTFGWKIYLHIEKGLEHCQYSKNQKAFIKKCIRSITNINQ